MKVARHYVSSSTPEDAGFSTENGIGEAVSGDKVVHNAQSLQQLLVGRIPLLAEGDLVHSSQCVYTMTTDEHL